MARDPSDHDPARRPSEARAPARPKIWEEVFGWLTGRKPEAGPAQAPEPRTPAIDETVPRPGTPGARRGGGEAGGAPSGDPLPPAGDAGPSTAGGGASPAAPRGAVGNGGTTPPATVPLGQPPAAVQDHAVPRPDPMGHGGGGDPIRPPTLQPPQPTQTPQPSAHGPSVRPPTETPPLPQPTVSVKPPVDEPPLHGPSVHPPIQAPPLPQPTVSVKPPVDEPPVHGPSVHPPIQAPPLPQPTVTSKPPVDEPPVHDPSVHPPIQAPPLPQPTVTSKPPVDEPPVHGPTVHPPIQAPPLPQPAVTSKPPVDEPPVHGPTVHPPTETPPLPQPTVSVKPPVDEPPAHGPSVQPPIQAPPLPQPTVSVKPPVDEPPVHGPTVHPPTETPPLPRPTVLAKPPVDEPPVHGPSVQPPIQAPPLPRPTVSAKPPVDEPPVHGPSVQPPIQAPPLPQPTVSAKPPVDEPPVHGPSVQPPIQAPPLPQPPLVTQPPVSQPPFHEPPPHAGIVTPPLPQPPLVTQPPVSQPPLHEPPLHAGIVTPPLPQPPLVIQPPVSQPPLHEPPPHASVVAPSLPQPPLVTQPPVSQPPLHEPPPHAGVVAPPLPQPPLVTQPPVSQPPLQEPPPHAGIVAPSLPQPPLVTQPPVSQPPLHEPPPHASIVTPPLPQPPLVTQPPVSQPPLHEPPPHAGVVAPPLPRPPLVTQPPVSQPPLHGPPPHAGIVTPPLPQPPLVTQPPVSQPPLHEPPPHAGVVAPPLPQPPLVTQPPVSQPPLYEPPPHADIVVPPLPQPPLVTQPPVSQPPLHEPPPHAGVVVPPLPPLSQPPVVTQPPVSQPPLHEPPPHASIVAPPLQPPPVVVHGQGPQQLPPTPQRPPSVQPSVETQPLVPPPLPHPLQHQGVAERPPHQVVEPPTHLPGVLTRPEPVVARPPTVEVEIETLEVASPNKAPAVIESDVGRVVEDVNVSRYGMLTAHGDIFVRDGDPGQDHMVPTVVTTPYGTFHVFADNSWSYAASNDNPLIQALPGGRTVTDTATVYSVDGTPHLLRVEIVGSDDTPTITATPGVVTEDRDVDAAGQLNARGVVTVVDADAGQSGLQAQTGWGRYGLFAVGSDGTWRYAADNDRPEIQQLHAGQSLTDSFLVHTADGTAYRLTVTIQGADDRAVIASTVGHVTEDHDVDVAGRLTTGGRITVSDPDAGDAAIATRYATGTYGRFEVRPDGTWTYAVDNNLKPIQALHDGETLVDRGSVLSADGTRHVIEVVIHGSDDAPTVVATPGWVIEDRNVDAAGQLTFRGTLSVSDPDAGQSSVPAQTGWGQYGHFIVNADGTWTYAADNDQRGIQGLDAGQTLVDRFTVRTIDGTPVQLQVTIAGKADAPVIVSSVGHVTEDHDVDNAGRLTASGTISVSDADAHQDSIATRYADGQYGRFEVRPDHTWTYSVDNNLKPIQGLGDGQALVDRATVLSADGTPHEIQVVIHGADEAPVVVPHPATITSTLGHVIEDRGADPNDQLVGGGALQVSDPDRGESHIDPQAVAGTYGRFEVENDHSWRYVADNGQRDIQALHEGERLVDSAIVRSVDGTAHELQVVIHGTNDGAVIRSTQGYAVEDIDLDRGGRLVASGTVTVSDPDAGENHVVADRGMGRYGEFTVNADGTWTYRADNAQRAIQSLDDGDTLTDRFTVHSVDGTAHELRVTIAGRDEAGRPWWGPAPPSHDEPDAEAPAEPYRAVVPAGAPETASGHPSDHPVAEYLAGIGVAPDAVPPPQLAPSELAGVPVGEHTGAPETHDAPHDAMADAFAAAPSAALPPESPPDPEHHQG